MLRAVRALAATLLLVVPLRASAVGLADPAAARAAAACQLAIAKAGAAFSSATAKSLAKCYEGVFACIQTKPGDPGCVAKAVAKCAAGANGTGPQARAKLATAIAKKCASVADLTSADGLGFSALATACQTEWGTTLADVASVADCVRAEHECLVELAFSVAVPRAGQLAADLAIPARPGSCLPNRGGGGDVGDPKLGKALAACQQALARNGASLAAAKLASVGKCVTTAFGCVQTKPGDPKCAAKAKAACDKAYTVDVPKAEARTGAAIVKKCGALFADVGGPAALATDTLAATCQTLGVASLAAPDDLVRCVLREHTCLAEERLGFAAPRAAALLPDVGRTLASTFCGPAPTPTATATSATATPTPSTTPTPTASGPAAPTPTATFTPAPGEVVLSVTKVGSGVGTVTFDPLGVVCGSTCAVSVAPGTPITLQARTQNGAGAYFQGFGGASCVGAARDCTIAVDADTHVDATFASQDFNLVFVTSGTFAADLGGTLPYDLACNDAASAAGINDADLNGTAFTAWISDTSQDAPTRLGSARGFVRLDGKPVADTLASLLADGILNPIRVDETGNMVASGLGVNTGTLPNGTVVSGVTCSDWSSSSGQGRVGRATDGPDTWTSFTNGGCGGSRLYCFMHTKNAALPTTPVAGKLAFLTNGPYVPGSGDPDARCEADKPAGTGAVVALLARTTAAAATLLDPAAVYVRPDGQIVGTGQTLIDAAASTGSLASGIWQSGDGTYFGAVAWTGSSSLTAVPSAGETCGNWAVAAGSGTAGFASHTLSTFWGSASQSCGSAFIRLYCVEQ